MYRPESHKTEHHDRERLVFIGPKARRVLWRYLARDALAYCFRPCDSEAKRRSLAHANRKTHVSCGNRPGTNRKSKPKRSAGEHYDTNAFRRAIHRAYDKAFPHPILGYKMRNKFTDAQKLELRRWQSSQRWSPNQLRHSAASFKL